ncbi:hypothetical protein D3C77_111670 [compost metagenome]
MRYGDYVGAFTVAHASLCIREHDQLASTGTYFLQVGLELLQQFVVRRHGYDRHVAVHQGQRAMLELSGRIGFGVDVGDFLELQGTFHCHRELSATAEEQGVVLVGEQLGGFLDDCIHRQGFTQTGRQATQFFDQFGFDTGFQGATHLAQGQGQQHQRHQLGGECLGRRHTDFRPGLGQQGQVGLTHQRADTDVADRQATEETQLLGIAQRGQGVCGFTRLRDRDKQGVGLYHDLAVAELAGDFDLARNTCQAFQPVTGNHAGVVAGAAGDDLYIAHLGKQLGGLRTERLDQHMILAQTAFQGALHHSWLLVDFLEHEVAVFTFVGCFRTFVILHGFTLDLSTGYIPDGDLVAADFGDVAFFQVHEAVGDLAQGQLVGGQEVLAMAKADHQRAAATGGQQAVRLMRADHSQAVGAMQLLDCRLQGIGQVRHGFQGVVQQVDDDFGVGLGAEHIAQALELLAQFFMVLDDTVVHHRQLLTGEMRVSIPFGRCTVSCPAGVGNAQVADQRLSGNGRFQFADLADSTTALQVALLGIDGQSSAVVATVFKALEAFDQNGSDITFGDGTNDSTHYSCSLESAAQITWMPRASICSRASRDKRSSVIRVFRLPQGSSRLGILRPTLSDSTITITSRATSAMTRLRPSNSLKVVVPRAKSMPSAPMNNWSKS